MKNSFEYMNIVLGGDDMLVDEIWDFKSINMGRELEISGEFIYESARKTMSITGLNNQYEITLTVERLRTKRYR